MTGVQTCALPIFESALFVAQREHVLRHINEAGELEDASLGILATNLSTNQNEVARKSSRDALLSVEVWVLANGFLDIVKTRNALARAQGFANFFDYKVQKNEQMSSAQLFEILDDFEARTREASVRALSDLTHKRRTRHRHAVSRRRARRASRQCPAKFAVLFARICAQVNGLSRNAINVLRQPARWCSPAQTLCPQRCG